MKHCGEGGRCENARLVAVVEEKGLLAVGLIDPHDPVSWLITGPRPHPRPLSLRSSSTTTTKPTVLLFESLPICTPASHTTHEVDQFQFQCDHRRLFLAPTPGRDAKGADVRDFGGSPRDNHLRRHILRLNSSHNSVSLEDRQP